MRRKGQIFLFTLLVLSFLVPTVVGYDLKVSTVQLRADGGAPPPPCDYRKLGPRATGFFEGLWFPFGRPQARWCCRSQQDS